MSEQPSRTRSFTALVVAATLAVGVCAWQMDALPIAMGQDAAVQTRGAEGVQQAESLSQAFRAAAEKTIPTVVTITSTTKPRPVDSTRRRRNPFEGTPFEDFFNDRDFGFQFDFDQPRRPRSGVGSGVIIHEDGIVLTNNHVVEGADEVVVRLSDDREFIATDIRTDKRTDLAVLRLKDAKPGSLPAAKLGDSDKLEIGDWVIAIGSPFQLDHTVSAGIISGKGRALGSAPGTRFLQTDAAINPGNSGGPLVNLDGEVVGINTAIATNSGGYQGIGFAIPINLAKWITEQLIEKGSVERAYLGVGITEINAALAEQFGVEPGAGVVVTQVYPDTPADKAGFQVGDVVTHYGDTAVKTPRELSEAVERSSVTSPTRVTIIRDGEKRVLTVHPASRPEDFGVAERVAPSEPKEQPSVNNEELGINVQNLTPATAQALGVDADSGVVVTEVLQGSIAAEAGIREGTVILRVGKTPVKNVDEFKAAMEKESLEDGILLLVRQSGANRFVVLQKSS